MILSAFYLNCVLQYSSQIPWQILIRLIRFCAKKHNLKFILFTVGQWTLSKRVIPLFSLSRPWWKSKKVHLLKNCIQVLYFTPLKVRQLDQPDKLPWGPRKPHVHCVSVVVVFGNLITCKSDWKFAPLKYKMSWFLHYYIFSRPRSCRRDLC